MGTYHLAYKGGTMAETEAEREASIAAWGTFLGGLGDSLVDAGNPFGPAATVAPSAPSVTAPPPASPATRSSRPAAWPHATATAKGCPVLTQGGSVEVHEIFPVM